MGFSSTSLASREVGALSSALAEATPHTALRLPLSVGSCPWRELYALVLRQPTQLSDVRTWGALVAAACDSQTHASRRLFSAV